jgi:Fe2+ transport system protein FeoA
MATNASSRVHQGGDLGGTFALSQLRQGERGRVDMSAVPCEECELLNAMGMTDRCEVRICRTGEPCIVQVHRTRLGISAALANRIYITLSEARPTDAR